MDFFDSWLFWVVVIWWLLTTFLGARARKRRAMQRLAEQEAELPTAAELDEIRFELEAEEEDVAPPREMERDEQPSEPATQPLTPSIKVADQPEVAPPRRATLPKPPLEQLARSLGIPKEFIPSGIVTSEEEPSVEVEAEAAEPESLPEKEIEEISPTIPVSKVSYHPEERQVAKGTAIGISHLQDSVLPSLTPLQQAIVLKEILDRPRAQRRGIR